MLDNVKVLIKMNVSACDPCDWCYGCQIYAVHLRMHSNIQIYADSLLKALLG